MSSSNGPRRSASRRGRWRVPSTCTRSPRGRAPRWLGSSHVGEATGLAGTGREVTDAALLGEPASERAPSAISICAGMSGPTPTENASSICVAAVAIEHDQQALAATGTKVDLAGREVRTPPPWNLVDQARVTSLPDGPARFHGFHAIRAASLTDRDRGTELSAPRAVHNRHRQLGVLRRPALSVAARHERENTTV